jgi:hypothetical protein
MKSRLKTYIVTVNCFHESFGGYDHNDGDEKFTVSALNRESAGKKALKAAYAQGGGYSYRLKEIQNEDNEDDWVAYS